MLNGTIPMIVHKIAITKNPTVKLPPFIAFFGSWFGRVLVDTGIAGSISRRTEKVGKKSPVLATVLIR
jgi:H+/gluconate symporter-like permease